MNSIRGLFKAVIKAVTQRDGDAPQPAARKRRSGEKEGGGPLRVARHLARVAGRSAARGRYTKLYARTAAQKPTPSGSEHEARARLFLSDTLDWFRLWQDNASDEQWLHEDFNAKQDHYYPQP